MTEREIISAPSNLGLHPGGVELLGESFLNAGFADSIGAAVRAVIPAPPYDARRDAATHLLNGEQIRCYSALVGAEVAACAALGRFPLVLGGDCSVLLGALLGMRELGRYGLFFLDGHADFYQPEASPTGEVADMELGLATGRGPEMLAKLGGYPELVRDEDAAVFGFRDEVQAAQDGCREIRHTDLRLFDLPRVRELGTQAAALRAVEAIDSVNSAGFWIHLDADVLDDAEMPAVDYRMPSGLSCAELGSVLQTALRSGRAVGMSVTIYNPALDNDGTAGARLREVLTAALQDT